MKKIFLFLLLFCFELKADEYSYSIIVGTPYKVKAVKEQSLATKGVIGAEYLSYFKDYRVIAGTWDDKRKLKLKLIATSDLTLTYYEEIYVLIKHTDNKVLKAVKWDDPVYSVCLDAKLIENTNLDEEFNKKVLETGNRCKSIYQHGKRNLKKMHN